MTYSVTLTAFAGLRFLIAEYARPRYLTAITPPEAAPPGSRCA